MHIQRHFTFMNNFSMNTKNYSMKGMFSGDECMVKRKGRAKESGSVDAPNGAGDDGACGLATTEASLGEAGRPLIDNVVYAMRKAPVIGYRVCSAARAATAL